MWNGNGGDGVVFRRVISHNDGLTAAHVLPSPLFESAPAPEYSPTAFVLAVSKYGDVSCRWSRAARHSYQRVNAYLLRHNCTSVCKKGPFCGGKSGAVIKQDGFLFSCARRTCLCTFLSMGQESRLSATAAYGVHLGDVPVSRTDPLFFFLLFFFHLCVCIREGLGVGVCGLCVPLSIRWPSVSSSKQPSLPPHRQMNY